MKLWENSKKPSKQKTKKKYQDWTSPSRKYKYQYQSQFSFPYVFSHLPKETHDLSLSLHRVLVVRFLLTQRKASSFYFCRSLRIYSYKHNSFEERRTQVHSSTLSTFSLRRSKILVLTPFRPTETDKKRRFPKE